MSRIGKQPIIVPNGVNFILEADLLKVTGPKGELFVKILPEVDFVQDGAQVNINRKDDEGRAFQGLIRTLVSNAVTGVSTGWKRELELNGVGMRATVNGSQLNLSLGFSHPVVVEAPEGITFVVTKNVISISGIDKQLVGETAAKIRKLRKPEPYKGKGIRYTDEYVRRKAGKTGKGSK